MLQVIGDPILHSKSPLIHTTMLRHLGLDIPYTTRIVKQGMLGEYLSWAKSHGVTGFNVTMPHKVDILPLLDHLDEGAALCQAVNTVCLEQGRWVGYNTDGAGCLTALQAAQMWPAPHVVILGAGGAAKAVALQLSEAGAKRIWVCNRTVDKARLLCCTDPHGVLTPMGFDPISLATACSKAQLVINCTNLGMDGCPHQFESFDFLDALPTSAGVMDLIYHPAQTMLLSSAHARGLSTCHGLSMLVYQAISALERFLGHPLPQEELKQVVFSALQA